MRGQIPVNHLSREEAQVGVFCNHYDKLFRDEIPIIIIIILLVYGLTLLGGNLIKGHARHCHLGLLSRVVYT